jgi:glycine/D-amino acid oxidase-like deaminating enzyme
VGRAEEALTVEPGLAPPWWLQEAPSDPEQPPLDGEVRADVAIVGAGFTGLWTALELKRREPGLDVVVLEAARCGIGPSGRNGGFLHGYWSSLARSRDVLGAEGALAVARAADGAIPAVRALGDDVWLREGGLVRVSTSPAQDRILDRSMAVSRELGVEEEAVSLSREELARHCSSPAFRRGVFFRDGATVHPARLVRTLRRQALAAGVRLHERTKVTRIDNELLDTKSGTVRAPEVVVATNAWGAGWKPLSRLLTPFGSYVVLTEPVPELLAEIGWTGGEAITDCRMFLHYFRTTDDGRVLMGSGSGPIGFRGKIDTRFSQDRGTAARAEAGLRSLLPGLAAAKVEHAWGGPIDVSADHLPVFGTVPGTRLHYGAGYTGNGVGPSWLGGQILASLALGLDDEWSRLPLVDRRIRSLPPEPINFLGGSVVRKALVAVEEAEEAGRTPSAFARLIASLPQRLGLRVGTR